MQREFWFTSIEAIREAIETDVLEQPGKIAKLPNSLGGDPRRWPSLAAAARRKDGFFELLWTKAHFLMLPKPIVTFMKDSSKVSITEEAREQGSRKAVTICTPLPDQQGKTSSMHIPGASDALAVVGHGLGVAARDVTDLSDPDEFAILGTVYHEMTHAWLCLQEHSDADIQKLYHDNVDAYEGSVGERGTRFAKEIAFSEAAGAYVEDRVLRWCTALYGLAQMLRDPAVLRWMLQTIPERYDRSRSEYGVVEGEKITSPPLPPALRAAINRKILDGRPLTEDFDDTPLAGLRDAISRL